MTNYERIMRMSIDELAEEFGDNFSCSECEFNEAEGCAFGNDCKQAFRLYLESYCGEERRD